MKKLAALFAIILLTAFSVAVMQYGISNGLDKTVSAADALSLVYSAGQKADRARIESFMQEFCADYYNRTAFSEAEKLAGTFIQSKFDEAGLTTSLQAFTIEYNRNTYKSQNIIAELPSPSSQKVIIGAFYDNSYAASDFLPESGTHGAYCNATGVAALIETARILPRDLPFDVIFVAFGADYAGQFGSYKYVDEKLTDPANVLLMINFDSVGGGDNLYLYTDEVEQEHDSYLRQKFISAGTGISLCAPPADKKTYLSGNYVSTYSHAGLASSHNIFLSKGLNCANFFAGNWETGGVKFVQSSTTADVLNTNRDTLENLQKDFPEYSKMIAAAVDGAGAALISDDFAEEMQSSSQNRKGYAFWADPLYSYIIIAVLAGACAIASIMLSSHLSKKHAAELLETLKEKPKNIKVFGNEYEGKPEDSNNKDSDNDNNPFKGY